MKISKSKKVIVVVLARLGSSRLKKNVKKNCGSRSIDLFLKRLKNVKKLIK